MLVSGSVYDVAFRPVLGLLKRALKKHTPNTWMCILPWARGSYKDLSLVNQPQMVVLVREIPPNPLHSRLGIIGKVAQLPRWVGFEGK